MSFDSKKEGASAGNAASKQVMGGDQREQAESLAARCKGDGVAFAKLVAQLPAETRGSTIAAAQRMYGNQFVTAALSGGTYAGMDVMQMAQAVMAENAAQSSADLKQVLQDMAASNEQKDKVRDFTTGDKDEGATEEQAQPVPRKP